MIRQNNPYASPVIARYALFTDGRQYVAAPLKGGSPVLGAGPHLVRFRAGTQWAGHFVAYATASLGLPTGILAW
jgi:hypothetical protein